MLFTTRTRAAFGGTQWLWLLWPLVVCIMGLQHIGDLKHLPIPYDAEHTYLPAAERFAREGWSFFLTPDSYRVVPLAYLWPALWQSDSELIRLANDGLWVACVWLLWDAARQLGGQRAGAFAMILLAINPDIYRYFPTELTEPIFLFGLLLWTWSTLRLLGAPSQSLVAASALGLCITLLSRPVLQLMAPVMLLAAAAWWWRARSRAGGPAVPRALCLSLALGLLVPVALLIKNGVMFGLWGLGTGSGAGLYLGTHPLFQGAEPAYLGFGFDINLFAQLAVGDADHLALAPDRAARMAGVWQLQSMSLGESASFLLRKLWWWLAHHPVMVQSIGGTLRKLRLFELLTLLSGALLMLNLLRRGGWQAVTARLPDAARAPRARLLGMLILTVLWLGLLAQLLPILYNHRYSTALLDPWLIVLAAVALALITSPLKGQASRQAWSLTTTGNTRVLTILLAPMLILLLANMVANQAKRKEMLRVDTPAETQALFALSTDQVVPTLDIQAAGPQRWVTTSELSVLSLPLAASDLAAVATANPDNSLWRLNLAVKRPRGKCKPLEVAYERADSVILDGSLLPLVTDGKAHTVYIHGNRALRPVEPGRLRLVFKCPVGTEITWTETSYLQSTHPIVAAQQVKARLAP